MTLTAWLLDEAWCGIHYADDSPLTITMQSNTAVYNASGTASVGATSWMVVNGAGASVGSGTMAASATAFTVCSVGSWIGGAAAVPGHYTVYTNSGTNGVVSGVTVICPANSNLYKPNSTGDYQWNIAAWLGSSPDRDSYGYQGTDFYTATAPNTAGMIVTRLAQDKYFTGPQDAARPHPVWVAAGPQSNYPTQDPTPTQWNQLAASLAANGHTGAYYELPTNEPENGSWPFSALMSYWNNCAASILAADSTAHVMGYTSAGAYSAAPGASVAAFLEGAASTVSAFTNHLENTWQNTSNFVALRQLFSAIQAECTTGGYPNLPVWFTETGIEGGQFGVLHPRRDARQRTILRLVAESYGWPKEHCYDFPIFDHHGSGLGTYLFDEVNGGDAGTGSPRAGAAALHVMAEALYGTYCSSASIPAKLSFGTSGSVGDSLFMGLHYAGSVQDVVVLATNGIESDTVILNLGTAASVATAWDGWGNTRSVSHLGTSASVAVDDLLTYVFLPKGSTVSVVDTASGVVSQFGGATNFALLGSTNNESGSSASVTTTGFFGKNNSSNNGYTIPGTMSPYSDSTVPGSITSSGWSGSVSGVAILTSGEAWEGGGCSLINFSIGASVGGALTTVDTYACQSASVYAIPSPSTNNSSDICTYTTWWTAPTAWLIPLSTAQANALKLTINATSYGGQPASVGTEGSSQKISLAEIQIYAASVSSSSSVTTGRIITNGTVHYRFI